MYSEQEQCKCFGDIFLRLNIPNNFCSDIIKDFL